MSGDTGLGGNPTPDVFGITDLIAPSESTSPSFNSNCGGVACGDDSDLSIVKLPGLTLDKTNPETQPCTDTDADGICDGNDYCLGTPANAAVLANGCGLGPGVPIVLSGVNFSPASATLSPPARAYLDEVVALIRELESPRLIIEGHTDDDGTEADNLALSIQRAESVFNYLVKAGIEKSLLAYRGRGETQALTPNRSANGQRNPDAQRINRRIELKLAEQDEFDAVRSEMQARETENRLVAERAARERQLSESREHEAQEKAQAAQQGYTEVLEFLSETGGADVSEQDSTSEPNDSQGRNDSEPEYTLEVIQPDQN